MLRLLQDSFIFEEATSSHFFRVTTLTQQLPFRSSYFLGATAFFRSFLCRRVISSQQVLFQNSYFFRLKFLPNSHFLRLGISLGQLRFGTALYLTEDYMVLEIQFRSVNYTLVARICKHFEQNKPVR